MGKYHGDHKGTTMRTIWRTTIDTREINKEITNLNNMETINNIIQGINMEDIRLYRINLANVRGTTNKIIQE